MDRNRFSRIRHSSLDICSPINLQDIEAAGSAIGRLNKARILDIGCGKAEILARLCEATGSTGIGIELPGSLGEELSELAKKQQRKGRIEIQFLTASDFLARSIEPYDVVIFSGASQAMGGFDGLRTTVSNFVKPAGWLVLGELTWRNVPTAEFLDKLGMRQEDLPHQANVPELLGSTGLNCIFWREVPRHQFLEYERSLHENGVSYARTHSHEFDAQEINQCSEDWFNLMNETGLNFFTFGWGLFRA